MARPPQNPSPSDAGDHGLRFLNDEWNDSIANGALFTLRWNQSVAGAGSELGLFKVTYPKDGLVVYEHVSNLTDSMDTESCRWTPQGLRDELYTLLLTTGKHTHHNWTMSPPWTPKKETGHHDSPWTAPFLIPLSCLLVLYALCLTICLVYRRRKRARRERFGENRQPASRRPASRHPQGRHPESRHPEDSQDNAADSAIPMQTHVETQDETGTAGTWIFTNSPVEADVTVGGVPDLDAADVDVERAAEDGYSTYDDQTIGIGL